VHEEKQQISGDYLYLRSIQGNNTDEHQYWPQMLKMNRYNKLEGMWRIAIAEKSQDEQMNQGNMCQMAKRGYYQSSRMEMKS
jgi:hypothetical protein